MKQSGLSRANPEPRERSLGHQRSTPTISDLTAAISRVALPPATSVELQRTVGNSAVRQLILPHHLGDTAVQRDLTKVVLKEPQPKNVEEALARLNDRITAYNNTPSLDDLTNVARALVDVVRLLGLVPPLIALRDQIRNESERFPRDTKGEKDLTIGSREGEESEKGEQPESEKKSGGYKRRGGRDVGLLDQLRAWRDRGLVPSPGDEEFFNLLFNSPDIMKHAAQGLDGAIYALYSHGGGTIVMPHVSQWAPICAGFWGALKGMGFVLQYTGVGVDGLDPLRMDPRMLQDLGSDFCYLTVNAGLDSAVRVYANVDVDPKVIYVLARVLSRNPTLVHAFKFAGPLSGGRSDGLVVWCPSSDAAKSVMGLIQTVHDRLGGTLGASRPAMTGQMGGSSGIGTGSEPLAHGLATGQRSTSNTGYSEESHSFGTIRAEVLARAVLLFRSNASFAATLGLSPQALFTLIAAGLFEEAGISGGAPGKPFERKSQ